MSNRQSWLNLISGAEGTRNPDGSRGYNIYYGGGTFDNTKSHPNKVIQPTQNSIPSSAAGAYQFMPGTWQGLGGGSMTPDRQDEYAYQLGLRRGVDFDTAEINPGNVALLAAEWASLPTAAGKSYYPNQRAKSMGDLYKYAGTDNVQQSASNGQQSAPQSEQVQNDQLPALIQLFEDSLGPSVSAPKTTPLEADADLLKEALTEEVQIANTEASNDSKAISDLQKTQEAIIKLLKQTGGQSEASSTKQALQERISEAYKAFTPGKSVI
tara:strand:- start:392 stop:1195 length:804 start_codon:yes stop_codon:yes gene_type:complete